MKRHEFLKRVEELVTKERNSEYGEPEDSFEDIAYLWGAYLNIALTPEDVAILMILLKVARLKENMLNKDSWLDIAGYAACGSEILSNRSIKTNG